MSTPRRSLNADVSWEWLLDRLDSKVQSHVLPAVAQCPLCRLGLVRIYQDRISGGQWHWCQNCGSTGDMIELAAKAWGLSITATVIKLHRIGFRVTRDQAAIRRYQREYVSYRQRISSLWDSSQQGLIRPSLDLQKLIHNLGLHCEMSRE